MPDKNTDYKRDVDMPFFGIECRASLDKSTPDSRIVNIEYTTGARVLRYNFWEDEYFYEELSTEPGHVRLEKLNNGAPVLDTHSRYSVENVFGVVEEADETTAKARFATDQASDIAYKKIKDKILRKVSVGYHTYRMEKVGEENNIPIYRATDWEPFEISLVPVPADDKAGIRSAKSDDKNVCTIINPAASRGNPLTEMKGNKMPETKTQEADAQSVDTRAAVEPESRKEQDTPKGVSKEEAARQASEAASKEKERILTIGEIARKHDLGQDFETKMIDDNKSIEDVRAAALDAIASKDDEIQVRTQIGVGRDIARDSLIEGAVNAIRHRTMPGKEALTDCGRQFRGISLLDLARECVGERGVYDKMELAYRAMNTTSDFSLILENVMHKNMRDMFEDTSRTFTAFARQSNFTDFRPKNSYTLGRGFDLQKVNEHGEYKMGQLVEGKEVTQADSYGVTFGITRKAIVNDDMDAFTRIPRILINAAAAKESDLVYDLLLSNPTLLEDNNGVFHADHGNLGSDALSIDGLSAGRQAMRTQLMRGGKGRLNIAPKTLLVPAALETEAYKLTAAIAPNASADVNPFAPGGKTSLQTVVESRLDDVSTTAWYLFADPNMMDCLEYGYLDGAEGPVLERNEQMNIDGIGFTLRHDFGAGFTEYRGGYKSTGA